MIWLAITSILFSSGLFAPGTSEADRKRELANYFNPKPDSLIEFDPFVLSNYKLEDRIQKIWGEIEVTPPKGTCLTITVNPEWPDQTFCKKGYLQYKLTDMDKVGRLSVDVSTGQGDFGTKLSWKSRHGIALAKKFDDKKSSPYRYYVIDRCEIKQDQTSRRIILHFVGGENWVFFFPEKHELLEQPPPPPNLMIVEDANSKGITAMAETRKQKKQTEQQIEEEGRALVQIADGDAHEIRRYWNLPVRDTYEMSADNFQPKGHVPTGGVGKCRYRFIGTPTDPNTGRIECHNGDYYNFIYAPLKCIHQIKDQN